MHRKSLQTLLSHSDYTAPDGFAAFPSAIHHASTVIFKDVAAMRSRSWQNKSAYTYGLHGTPTSFTLEARLAEIEDARHCLLAPSGLAAIAIVNRQGVCLKALYAGLETFVVVVSGAWPL